VHRLLKEPADYAVDLGRSVIRGWDRFFFTPADPLVVGLLRIILGALLFWDIAVLGFDLYDFLGSDGWISVEAVRHYLGEWVPGAWSLWLYVPDRWLRATWALCLVVIALFTAGYRSRVTAVLAWAIALSTVRRAPAALFGFDYMIATWTFYLAAFGASGQALSVDRLLWLRRSKAAGADVAPARVQAALSASANLTIRMIQLHLCLIYGSAGLSKLMGMEWWNGTAMEMIILTPEFRRLNLVWLTAYPLFLNFATHFGLFLEVMYPVLIWNSKIRPLLIASAVVLHLGIDLLLGLTEFGLAMIAGNLAFVSGAWIRQLVNGPREPWPGDDSRAMDMPLVRDAANRRSRKRSLEHHGAARG
jgi:hypothetical protein